MSGDTDVALYTILGSHACRTAMLMLDRKGIAYRTVELPSGMHPLALRLAGFGGGERPVRLVDGQTPPLAGVAGTMGTVPALKVGRERVRGSRAIARFLDRVRADPPLFPADADARARVEEAERWGDETLQMTSRRLALIGTLSGRLHDGGADGRLGPLLFRSDRTRRAAVRLFTVVFSTRRSDEAALLDEARAGLDHVDGLIDAGVLGGAEPNAADFTVVTSLALLDYHVELRDELRARPAGRLLDRLLPEI